LPDNDLSLCALGAARKNLFRELAGGAIGNKPPVMLLNHDGAASPPA
jgi:hypothetical protein